MSDATEARPTVVVVGGGYGGASVAKALEADANVALVEPRDTFMHNIGALRALVDVDFLPTYFCRTTVCSRADAWCAIAR